MNWFPVIKRYYDNGHPSYTNEGIKVFVKAQMITIEEYEEITEIPYVVA